MNPRFIQEVHLIRWPWCLMTLAGLIPVIKPFLTDKRSDLPEGIAVFGFFGGAAFLTALSFRRAQRISPAGLLSEGGDQHSEIWSEQMVVLAVAMVAAGLIVCFLQAALGTIVWRDFSVQK